MTKIIRVKRGRRADGTSRGTKSYVKQTCVQCESEFLAQLCYVQRGQGKTCSQKCRLLFYRQKNPRLVHTYVYVYMPNHPRARKGGKCGYVLEHIVVAERSIGRSLAVNEVVHHINGNKTDNSPDNLLVMDRSAHGNLHHTNRVCPYCGRH